MAKRVFQHIPIKYREVYRTLIPFFRLQAFREMYYSEDKGWRYHWDKFKDEDEEGFPITQANSEFDKVIKLIEENFRNQDDRYQLLMLLKDEVNQFSIKNTESAEEMIEHAHKVSRSRGEGEPDVTKYKRDISVGEAIRKVYQSKFKEYEYKWSGREQKDKEEQEYIDSWFDQSVTLDTWKKNKNIDHWYIINQMDPTDNEVIEIENHQYYLFQEAVKNSLKFLLEKYSNRDVNKRIEIHKSHIETIENFFEKGFDSDGNLEKLKSIYRGIATDKKALIQAYSKVVLQEFDYQEDFLLCVPDTYKTHPTFLTVLFYNYKKEAEKLIDKLSKPSSKARTKKPRFSIKQPHNTIWLKDLLIQLNFKIEFLEDVSDLDLLYSIFTAQNYNDIKGKVSLRCRTNQFVYILRKLKPNFSNLTYAEIERSKKFVSNEGNLIKADNLSNSYTDNPKDKEEIDAVFKDFMK